MPQIDERISRTIKYNLAICVVQVSARQNNWPKLPDFRQVLALRSVDDNFRTDSQLNSVFDGVMLDPPVLALRNPRAANDPIGQTLRADIKINKAE